MFHYFGVLDGHKVSHTWACFHDTELIVARSTGNASIDSCHVARITILILESTDSD